MATLILFAYLVLQLTLTAIVWLVIASAIVSWLVAFDVINMRNRMANQAVGFLNAVTRPLLAPFRRFIPPLGGMDVSPIVLIILITATQQVLLPAGRDALLSLLPA